jgi:hypothetical protein
MEHEDLRELAASGLNDSELGRLYGVSPRTIHRWRKADGIESGYVPPKSAAQHGTHTKYLRGCRCEECRRANAARYAAGRSARVEVGIGPGDKRHGRASTAINWGCRCEQCLAALSAKNAADARRRRGGADPAWRKFSEREDEIVRALPPKDAAQALDRSISAIYKRRVLLGITRS